MPDIEAHLRAYLDQTVERVDVSDVLARARVRKQWTLRPLVHWRPAWIAAAAALIMVVSIGAVAAGAWILRGNGLGNLASQLDGPSQATGEWPGVLILGLAIGGGTMALLASGTALTNLIYRMRDRRKNMQTIEAPELELARLREDNVRLGKAKQSLIIALVIVLIASASAAAWLIATTPEPLPNGRSWRW